MENRYPLFAGGRILKKEALWDLRDYAYAGWQLQYADYTDGVVKGCRVRVEGNGLIVGKGMMKCGDFIYLMDREERVPYEAGNCMTVLKAAFEPPEGHLDHLTYEVRFFLDHEVEREKNQIELCRFHLREGSMLRDQYKGFSDMGTEYDTINLVSATVAGRGRVTLHSKLMQRFVDELQVQPDKQLADYALCYAVKGSGGSVPRALIASYLADKGCGSDIGEVLLWSNERLFRALCDILSFRPDKSGLRSEKLIYVD